MDDVWVSARCVVGKTHGFGALVVAVSLLLQVVLVDLTRASE